MLRIVTDGAADMPNEWLNEYDIQVIPINIHFGDKTYRQYLDLDNEEFYRIVENTNKIPKTSQPSPHQFSEFYRKIASPGGGSSRCTLPANFPAPMNHQSLLPMNSKVRLISSLLILPAGQPGLG